GAAGHADVSNDIASFDDLSDVDVEAKEMAEASSEAVAVIENNKVAVIGFSGGVDYPAVRRRLDRSPIKPADIDPQLHFTFAGERILAIAKWTRDAAPQRPLARGRAKAGNVVLDHWIQNAIVAFEVRGTIAQNLERLLQIVIGQ